MQLEGINSQTIEQIDLQRRLNEAIIGKYIELEKHRRFKIGCPPSVCDMERLMFISDNLCKDKCYLTEEDYQIINETVIKYG